MIRSATASGTERQSRPGSTAPTDGNAQRGRRFGEVARSRAMSRAPARRSTIRPGRLGMTARGSTRAQASDGFAMRRRLRPRAAASTLALMLTDPKSRSVTQGIGQRAAIGASWCCPQPRERVRAPGGEGRSHRSRLATPTAAQEHSASIDMRSSRWKVSRVARELVSRTGTG